MKDGIVVEEGPHDVLLDLGECMRDLIENRLNGIGYN